MVKFRTIGLIPVLVADSPGFYRPCLIFGDFPENLQPV
jgi:hypothetical protein